MITKIEARNYRCLAHVSQGLGNFHIITGPNGSGKSTFLEVPQVMAAFAAGGLEDVWDKTRTRSMGEILFQGKGTYFDLAVEARIPDAVRSLHINGKSSAYSHVRYEVRLGLGEEKDDPLDWEPRILAENLWLFSPNGDAAAQGEQQRGKFPDDVWLPDLGPMSQIIHRQAPSGKWKRTASKSKNQNSNFTAETTGYNLQIKNPASKSALSTLPEDEVRFPLSNWFKTELAEHVQKILLNAESMMLPSSPLKGRRFAVDGSNLPQVVRELKKDTPSWTGWLEHLRTILPIEDIEVIERDEDKTLYLKVKYKSGHEVKSWHLSDGTLRLLALTLLAYIPDEGSIYLIEEPENGVHPQAIEALYQSLSALTEGQVLLATHSPVLVAQATPAQLLCFAKCNDATDIVRGDLHPKLKNWKSSVNLAQLYAAGILS
ncbi:MAG: AAA family ATPase [Prosthecobacter sp.]|uniref:methylation-associated defense system AAA family ATPase MAD3 n=1 Tax=Prosthecobacter sp. TaxID=1965333 RepID=UPI0025D47809|nr:ATP-binding protein [Prosthecobacter sp.]MCF7788369.1 AAA family ATPase [Prosthecobacter sp.]